MSQSGKMVQYGVWPNCCNDCDFCLRENRETYTTDEQIFWLQQIRKNIDFIDWKEKFSYGISLLGGELYFITNRHVQDEFMLLIDDIIDKILLVSQNPMCKYSTVTNGLYDPAFLYRVIDRIVQRTDLHKVDINFSYDLKYRYKKEDDRLKALKNINDFHNRYNYKVGVQMILTQHIINLWKLGEFDVNCFIDEQIPGNQLSFLYPHPIHTGRKLDDFNFSRSDLMRFLSYLRSSNLTVYKSFISSTNQSGIFKYTGFRDRIVELKDYQKQQPILSDGKQIINEKCGHSVLYQCYNDSDQCMLCDLKNIAGDII